MFQEITKNFNIPIYLMPQRETRQQIVENIRFVCVYDGNKLTDISGSDGYGWRLALGVKSWKDALIAVIVFVFKEK